MKTLKIKDQSTKYKVNFTLIFLLLSFIFLLGASATPQSYNEKDTLLVDVSESTTLSDSTDLGQQKLLAIIFPAAMTSDTVFVQDKNLPGETFQDVYYTDQSGKKIRVHVVVQLGKKVQVNPIMTFGLSRYVRFVTDDAEAADRLLVAEKGNYE